MVLQSSSFMLVLAGALVAFSPAPALIARLGADRATSILSVLAAGSALVEILLSPVLGSVIDSIGRKPVMAGVVLTLSLANGLVAVNPSCITCICFARVIGMLCLSQFFVVSQAIVSDIAASDPTRLSAAMGVQMALLGAGFLVGALAAGRLADFGLSASYGSSAVVGALAVILVSFGMPETLPQSKRIPFQAHATRKLILQSPLSCTRLLFRRGSEVRILTILLLLQSLPQFMGAFFQIFANTEWNLTTKEFSSFIAMWGVIGIVANTVGSVMVRRYGIKRFMGIATLSSMCGPIGASFFGFRGSVIGSLVGFLGAAQAMGVTAALVTRGEASGVPHGELAGERASLVALLKVIGPILYSALYVQGRGRLGMAHLPFIFNIVLAAGAFIVSQLHLPREEKEI
jgi:DHA1 family tetracycline resistance protein-like MFS transporter